MRMRIIIMRMRKIMRMWKRLDKLKGRKGKMDFIYFLLSRGEFEKQTFYRYFKKLYDKYFDHPI